MDLKPISVNPSDFPAKIAPFLSGGKIFDSSCSPEARVLFSDQGQGVFIKSAAKGTLADEAEVTRYFHGKGLAAEVLAYASEEQDWLVTEKVAGEDCTSARYLEQPEHLCDILASRLFLLHQTDYAGCPVQNRMERYAELAHHNYHAGDYDRASFPGHWGYQSAEDVYSVTEKSGGLLQDDTLLHGDYCLPNVILDDWQFSGFIDLDSGGVGERHMDLFWGIWSLAYNLKTDKYRQRFIDGYGRNLVDEEKFRIVAAFEVFR